MSLCGCVSSCYRTWIIGCSVMVNLHGCSSVAQPGSQGFSSALLTRVFILHSSCVDSSNLLKTDIISIAVLTLPWIWFYTLENSVLCVPTAAMGIQLLNLYSLVCFPRWQVTAKKTDMFGYLRPKVWSTLLLLLKAGIVISVSLGELFW